MRRKRRRRERREKGERERDGKKEGEGKRDINFSFVKKLSSCCMTDRLYKSCLFAVKNIVSSLCTNG